MPNDTSENESDNEMQDSKDTSNFDNLSHEDLQQKLTEVSQKSQDYWERIIRMQAENENILRRCERDVASAHKYALEKFVNELLPIVDSLELCVGTEVPDKNDSVTAVIDGVNLTLKMFYAALEKFGVKQINPLSQAFNPEFEQAISIQVDPDLPAGTVTSVLQKGYTLNNRLIRPALVVVSKTEE